MNAGPYVLATADGGTVTVTAAQYQAVADLVLTNVVGKLAGHPAAAAAVKRIRAGHRAHATMAAR